MIDVLTGFSRYRRESHRQMFCQGNNKVRYCSQVVSSGNEPYPEVKIMVIKKRRHLTALFTSIFCILSLFACSGGNDPSAPNDRQSAFLSADVNGAALAGNAVDTGGREEQADEQEEVKREIEEADIIKVTGTNLYILNQYRGLAVCNVSSPDHPSITGRCAIEGEPIEMYIQGNYAYVIVSVLPEQVIVPMSSGIALDSASSQVLSRVEVINISDASNPIIEGTLNLDGRVTDSRIVGSLLYVVSSEEPVYSYTESIVSSGTVTSGGYNVFAASIDLSDPAHVVKVDSINFGGSARFIHVTDHAIFIASDSSAYSNGGTNIAYVDISDPNGEMRNRGSFDINGTTQDEFKMDYYNGYFRICTHEWTAGGGLSRLYVYNVTDPDAPVETGSLELGQGEQLFATRFDQDRAYMVTFEQIDPLWVIDLSNPEAPQIKGELTVPGWSTYIQPVGDNLVALGTDGSQVSVSLFNVADPAHPALTKRVSFGEQDGWTWSTASDDVKSLTIMEDMGLILLPYTTYHNDDNGYVTENRLQLIDYTSNDLVPRGWVAQKGNVLRGTAYSNRLFSVSNEELQVIDASDRDNPQVTAELPLAVNVVDFAMLKNGFGARITDSDGELTLQAVSGDDMEDIAGEISIKDSGYVGHFVNEDLVYIVTSYYGGLVYMEGAAGDNSTQPSTHVRVFDFSEPAAPVMRGEIEIEGSYYTPVPLSDACVKYPYYGSGQIVQVKDDLLALVTLNSYYGEAVDSGLKIVDLSDPDNPDLANSYPIEAQDATGFFAKSGIIYYSYTEDAGSDSQGRPQVKYYLGRIDMADPAAPVSLTGINIPGICVGMDATGAYVYTIGNRWTTETDYSVDYIFSALQLNDNAAYLMDETELSEYCGHFTFADGFAYIDGYDWTSGLSKMIILDLADPEDIKKYENELSLYGASIIGAKNRTVFLSLWSGIGCYDVSNPASPELTDFQYGYAWNSRVTFTEDRAFVPMGYNGIWVKSL